MGQGHVGSWEALSLLQTGWESLRSEPKGEGCEVAHWHPGEMKLVPIILSALSSRLCQNAGLLESGNPDRFWETTGVWLKWKKLPFFWVHGSPGVLELRFNIRPSCKIYKQCLLLSCKINSSCVKLCISGSTLGGSGVMRWVKLASTVPTGASKLTTQS